MTSTLKELIARYQELFDTLAAEMQVAEQALHPSAYRQLERVAIPVTTSLGRTMRLHGRFIDTYERLMSGSILPPPPSRRSSNVISLRPRRRRLR